MEIGYGLEDWGVGVRVSKGSRIFSSPNRADRLWGLPNLLSNGYRGLFPGCKAARAWSWSLTSRQCRGQENVDLYINSAICLHNVMLNSLSTGKMLPFYIFTSVHFSKISYIRRTENFVSITFILCNPNFSPPRHVCNPYMQMSLHI
jgi:hypothetical protein